MPSEGEDTRCMRRRRGGCGQRDQFEEATVELNQPVLGAPGVHIARANLEAKPPVERGLSLKITGGQHEMVDAAGGGDGHPSGIAFRPDDANRRAHQLRTGPSSTWKKPIG
jgi:hypothetical protein